MKPLHLSDKTKGWLYVGLQVMIIILAVAVGYFGSNWISISQGEYELIDQAKRILVENTILEMPSDEQLQHGMIRGMLETLNDPFTYFVEPAAHEVQTDQLAGRFGGIGVRLERDTDLNWRLYPFPESPALMAGVEDGDILIGVDGLAITKETDDITLIAAVRGPVGEEVNISVLRGTKTFDFRIKREDIPLPTVSWNLLPEVEEVGLVKINQISETTAEEVESAVQELIDKGAASIILDLRNNSGGLVESGMAIANLFLEEGEVLHQQINKDEEEVFSVNEPGPFIDIPMVILVNGNTASSAEIVVGAFKKHDRAPIVGSQTYGKTSIQYIFDLKDGSSIHITSGIWWISGVTFPLQPDYLVLDDPTGVNALQKAIDVLQGTR
jgi:carboxyl-terminal processing protease